MRYSYLHYETLIKHIAFILTSLLVFSFGLANAQSASVTATLTAGGWGTDTLLTGVPVEWTIHFVNNSGGNVTGSTNGWQLTSSAARDSLSLVSLGLLEVGNDGGTFLNWFSNDGSGTDTIA